MKDEGRDPLGYINIICISRHYAALDGRLQGTEFIDLVHAKGMDSASSIRTINR